MFRSNNNPIRRLRHGFTLVEVLIALAILAIALAAASRAASTATTSAQESKLRTLALWVAQNRAAELATQPFPEVGTETGSAEMAGVSFSWSQRTVDTPNRDFRKAVIEVRQVGNDTRSLATLNTYVARSAF
jgi:general secretion pathway protein I